MDGVISILCQKKRQQQILEVTKLIKKEINDIIKENADVNIELAFDQGIFVEQAIGEVIQNGIMGALLAMLILFLFLKNLRPTLVIAISIPISVISTFVLLYISNTTLNMISMGGLALGVGMMVDNAIVVLESIYRHRKEGKGRIEAALTGTKEVGGAIIASTLTTVVVFVPIVFTEGIASEVFKEMALTVTFSLLASLAVALTIVPMLSSKMLNVSSEKEGRNSLLSKI